MNYESDDQDDGEYGMCEKFELPLHANFRCSTIPIVNDVQTTINKEHVGKYVVPCMQVDLTNRNKIISFVELTEERIVEKIKQKYPHLNLDKIPKHQIESMIQFELDEAYTVINYVKIIKITEKAILIEYLHGNSTLDIWFPASCVQDWNRQSRLMIIKKSLFSENLKVAIDKAGIPENPIKISRVKGRKI